MSTDPPAAPGTATSPVLEPVGTGGRVTSRRGRRWATGLVLAALAALPAVAHAATPVAPYRAHDAGGFHDVLPPGTSGLVTGAQLGVLRLAP